MCVHVYVCFHSCFISQISVLKCTHSFFSSTPFWKRWDRRDYSECFSKYLLISLCLNYFKLIESELLPLLQGKGNDDKREKWSLNAFWWASIRIAIKWQKNSTSAICLLWMLLCYLNVIMDNCLFCDHLAYLPVHKIRGTCQIYQRYHPWAKRWRILCICL